MSRSFGVTSFTTRPPIRISPSLISSSPATMRSAVVFPQPDGPTKTMNSPSSITRSSASTARGPVRDRLSTRPGTRSLPRAPIDQPLIAPPRPEPRRNERWKIRKPTMGTRQAMNIAARKTPSSRLRLDRRQPHRQRLLVGLVSTSSGQRKSFHDARMAKTETTPRIGLRHRQHDRQEQPEGAGAVDSRRLEDLARQVVEEPLDEHDVEGARAGRQPDRPVAVDERMVDQRRVHDLDVQRHEQHHDRHEQRRVAAAP